MADQGGSQHGIARTSRAPTEEQRLRDLERIKKYRELEDHVRARVSQGDRSPDVFQLTSKLLRLNPEYYTIWNVRRACVISSGFSASSPISSCSRASSTSSNSAAASSSSATCSASSSAATPPNPASPTTGRSGTTAEQPPPDDKDDGSAEKKRAQDQERDRDLIRSELAFTTPLLRESPKCYWIWSYRLWILRQAIERLPAPAARRIWEEELGLASKMLARDRRNFHAWGYRRHVVAQLESPALGGGSMAEAEFAYTDSMIRSDLSNFSAWHGRSKLIPRLLDERGADGEARRAFLEKELGTIRDAINVGPEDQSLWYYYQFLILNLVSLDGRPSFVPELSAPDRVAYLRREIEEIKDLLEDYTDVQLIYEGLFDYTLYLCQLEGRQPDVGERADLAAWLGKLKELDPMRQGRWADLERDLALH